MFVQHYYLHLLFFFRLGFVSLPVTITPVTMMVPVWTLTGAMDTPAYVFPSIMAQTVNFASLMWVLDTSSLKYHEPKWFQPKGPQLKFPS